MAKLVQKNKVPFPYFDNTEGLNTNSIRFEKRENQALEAMDVIYTKKGGFKGRRGQELVNANQPAGFPELVYGIEFVRTEGGITTQKKISWGADGNVYDFSTNPPTIILSGLTPNAMPDAAVIHGWLCFVNGVDQPRKWDMTNWYQWGIDAPASAPSGAAGGAGSPNGTYRFRVSFLRVPGVGSIDPGHESSMGTISSTVTVANQEIDLTSIPVSTDPQVNARRVYVEIGGQWYLATEISDNTTTTYTYDALDSATVLGEKGRTDRNPIPETTKIIEQHHEVTFGSDSQTLIWSIFDEFESFSELNRKSNTYQTNDGAPIVGLRSHIDLVVAKLNVLWVREGDDLTYSNTKKVLDSGCIARNSMVVKDTKMYYLAHDGFRVFDGNTSRIIHRNIENLLTGVSVERLLYQPNIAKISGCFYGSNLINAVVWAIPTSSTQYKNLLLYSEDFKTVDSADTARSGVGVWYAWSNMDARFIFKGKDSATNFDKLYSCGMQGFMRALDTGYTDLGAPITPVYRQTDLFFKSPNSKKRMRDSFFVVSVPEGNPTGTYQVEWYVDGLASGVQETLDFCTRGYEFDDAGSIFDTARFATEGTFVAEAQYGPDPFVTIAPRITWTVSEQSDDVLWNGWTLRIIDAGFRRENC